MIVDDEGDVGIGGSYGSSVFQVVSDYQLAVSGKVYMNGGVGAGVTIEDYYGDVFLHGGFTNGGYLGNINNYWGKVYTDKLYYNNMYQGSDLSIKENITNLESSLADILLIRTVKYDLKESFFENSDPAQLTSLLADRKNKVGIIAQEMKEVLPDLVKYDEEDDLHFVNYTGLIPFLIKAIQEQQEAIVELEKKVKKIKEDKDN